MTAVKTSSWRGRRETRAAESFRTVGECIGQIERGMSVFALTRGQWSMIDAILWCLDCVGRSRISVWTWVVAEYEVQVLARLRDDARVSGGLLLLDGGARYSGMRSNNAEVIAAWRRAFGWGSVKYCANHAKIATVESESGFRLLLRGSMNLNFNPRFEQFDLCEGSGAFDLIRRIEDELPTVADDASKAEMWRACGIQEAFPPEQLQMFKRLKIWAK